MSVVVVNWMLIGRKFYNYYLKDYQWNNCVEFNQNGVVQQMPLLSLRLIDGRRLRKNK